MTDTDGSLRMATSPRTTAKKTGTAGPAPVAEEKTSQATADTYTGQAADLAAQARTLADEAAAGLAEVLDAFKELGNTERDVAQAPIWEAARRIAMSGDDLKRALDAFTAVTNDLAARASS